MATPTDQLLSRTIYSTDGTTTVWDFSFSGGYIDAAHVKAYTETPAGIRTAVTGTLIGAYQLQITPAIASGDTLVIYRDTPKSVPLVDFTDESGFSEVALDTNAKQAVFIAAEGADILALTDLQAAFAAAGAAALSASASEVAAAASELATSNLAAAVNANAANINLTAANTASIATVATNIVDVNTVAANIATVVEAASILNVTTFAQTLLDDTTEAAARTTLGAAASADLAAPSGASLVGTTPAGNLAGATVAAQLNELDTEKAKVGANSDITSLTGLTTPLSVEQGGTGRSTPVIEKIRTGGVGELYSFGDSYTLGQGASGYNAYVQVIAARINATVTNLGVSGTGVTKAVTQAFQNLPNSYQRTISFMAGLNDLYRTGPLTTTLNKLTHATTAFIANAFLKTAVPVSDASVTKTGSWGVPALGYFGEKAQYISGTPLFSDTLATDKLAWTCTGDSLVIGCWDTDGVSRPIPDFDIYIDGVLKETVVNNAVSDGNTGGIDTYGGLTHKALVYFGLGSGSHSCELRAKTVGTIYVDYVGTLLAPGDCPSVLVADIANMNAAGYALEPLRSIANDQLGSNALRAAVTLFKDAGYPVVSISTNDFFDTLTDVGGDNVHPNVLGHKHIADAFLSGLRPDLTSGASISSADVTPAAGFAHPGPGGLRVSLINGVVVMAGCLDHAGTVPAETAIGTIPVAYAPSNTLWGLPIAGYASPPAWQYTHFRINPDGTVMTTEAITLGISRVYVGGVSWEPLA